jgi:hypothetical protein
MASMFGNGVVYGTPFHCFRALDVMSLVCGDDMV